MSFFTELKRRNVFRVGIAYAVAAWVLLQVVDLVFEYITAPAWIMQVLMLALAIGLPLVLILAWVFELTPEGIKRETAVEQAQSVTRQTGRKLDRVIIAFLALAVVFLLADRFRTEKGSDSSATEVTQSGEAPATAQKDKSIAVLPLVNRSVNAEDAFFAEGLHDELLTQLSRISALRVISRTSVMGYAGTTKRMPEIGRELGVATLLEGGVQRSGNRVRINVQLIDAATDEHLWAEVYDRELNANNLFDIQSDITAAIANALQAVLTGEEQRSLHQKPTDNVDAYAHYLRGKAAAKGYGREIGDIDKSIASFQAAIELDPQFAEAYAALAIDWTERYWGTDKTGEELKHALDALQHAQTLAPGSADTLTAEGYYHYWGHMDYAPAIAAFGRVLEREPGNYLALRGKAYVLRRQGQFNESIATLEKALTLDPLDSEMPSDIGYTMLRTGQIDAAEVMMRRSVTLAPDRFYGLFTLAELFMMKGELEAAWQLMDSVDKDISPGYLDSKFYAARALANPARVDQVLDIYVAIDSQSIGPEFARALVYLERGEQDRLSELLFKMQADLQTAERERPGTESTLLDNVRFQGLKKDQAKLRAAVAAFYAGVKPDALRLVENRTIPTAYAIAGDSEALLDYLDELVERFGPWEFYYFAIEPSFDSMRGLPRFQAHDKRYREWLEQLP